MPMTPVSSYELAPVLRPIPRAAAHVLRRGPAAGGAERVVVRLFCQRQGGEPAELVVRESGAGPPPDTPAPSRPPPLPRGKYVIHAWHPRLGEQTVPIDIEHTGPLSV